MSTRSLAPLLAITAGLAIGGIIAVSAEEPERAPVVEAQPEAVAILIPPKPMLPMALPEGLRKPAAPKEKTEREIYTAGICRMIELNARAHALPPEFLARLIWQESRFDRYARSPVGAQGIAQFMPYTAKERGLDDPDDPRQAIAASAQFLRHLHNRFGNLGLAAAAYNGGPNRVSNWLAGRASLALETENYVRIITRHPADHWRKTDAATPDLALAPNLPFQPACERLPALLRKEKPPKGAPTLPWGAQISAHFKQHIAVAAFERAKRKSPSAFAGGPLNVTRATVRTRGPKPLYRAALGAPSRQKAEALCGAVRSSGGACIVVKQ